MAPLKDTQRSTDFLNLLNTNQSEKIRAAALHALRELGDKNTSDVIAGWLANEPSAALRADAIEALNTTGNFVDDAQALYDRTKPGIESDPAVRDKAWQVWDILLGECTDIATLNNWRHTMFNDGNVQQRILVLNKLNDNLLKQNQLSDLAVYEQETGDAYMQVGRPDLAAAQYQNAWDYYAKQHIQNLNTAALVDDLMKAYLQSKQYDKAVGFGQGALAQDPEAVGKEIRESVDQLSSNPATHADAAKLIDLALKMSPGIPEPYHQDLVATQKQLSGGK
jgi:tetratricopeptide (TPR) repeat protein